MKFRLNAPEKIVSAARELNEFGIELSEDGIPVTVAAGERFTVLNAPSGIRIEYQKLVQVFYALRALACGEKFSGGEPLFRDLTYMCDCSRNAVPKVSTLKKLARYLAVMGYDSLGLYLEDTFRVEKYPYFGYLRTPYSKEDLIELDADCKRFGIELVPYIQTLAHFNTLTRHYAMEGLFDTGDILLVGEESTYEFIEELIKTCAECFSSRSINVGMDEAYMLGRGRYFDLHGARPRFEIMSEHLGRVVAICRKYGFRPMIWSDMFFTRAMAAQYGDDLPEGVRVPGEVELIYWDYGNTDEEHYRANLKKHLAFHGNIGFAGGACKWHGFTPDNRNSFRSCLASVRACEKEGIGRYIVTGWGDNGAECSQFAVLPTLYYCSRMNYGKFEENEEFRRGFKALTGMPLKAFMTVDLNNRITDGDGGEGRNTANKYLLFNDVLLGTLDTTLPEGAGERYRRHAEALGRAKRVAGRWNYLFDVQYRLARVLAHKADLGIRLRSAYRANDRETLFALRTELNETAALVRVFATSFRRQWSEENRENGFDVQDLRLGGLLERLRAAGEKLENYLNGNTPIPELEESLLDFLGNGDLFEADPDQCEWRWRRMSSVNVNE